MHALKLDWIEVEIEVELIMIVVILLFLFLDYWEVLASARFSSVIVKFNV